jgi:hypothetical protein
LLKREGYTDLLCRHIPPPSKYECYNRKLMLGLVDVNKVSVGKAVEEHVAAAFDGSWQKGGHPSLNGGCYIPLWFFSPYPGKFHGSTMIRL